MTRLPEGGKDDILAGDTKLFGRYHDVVLLVIGFFLTTVVGGFLTYWYQELAWQRDYQSRLHQEELARSSEVFDEISKLLDKRMFRLREVVWAIEDNISSGKTTDEDALFKAFSLQCDRYRQVITEWNENLNRNMALTERYFGPTLRQELESSIKNGFRNLHKELNTVMAAQTVENVDMMNRHLDAFDPKIYQFNLRMLDALKLGKIGSFL